MVFRAISGVVSAAAVAVAAAGLLPSSAAQAAPSEAAPSQAAQSQAVQLSGTQLLPALLPLTYFPHGYVRNTVTSSGSHLETALAKYNPATMSCRAFLTITSDQGFGETATAADAFANRGATQGFTQVVYQFASTGKAAAFYHGMSALYARCRMVRFTIRGTIYQFTTQSLTQTRIGGHQAFYANVTLRVSGPDEIVDVVTSVAHGVWVLAGTDVFIIGATGARVPPASPSPTAAVLRLIARVQAIR